MQIQWREDAVLRYAEAVRQSTTDDSEKRKGEESAKLVRREDLRKKQDAVCRTARDRETERAEARTGLVWEGGVSCGNSDQGGRRTKLDRGSSESLDDFHRCTAFWAEPKII